MPMYKKSLCILLLIALISGGGVFYNQFTNKEKTIETPSTDITENIPVNDEVTIYVSGEVNSPGVITLDSNCRIKDAIIACGDFTPLADKNSVNLAQKVTDGMQIKYQLYHKIKMIKLIIIQIQTKIIIINLFKTQLW